MQRDKHLIFLQDCSYFLSRSTVFIQHITGSNTKKSQHRNHVLKYIFQYFSIAWRYCTIQEISNHYKSNSPVINVKWSIVKALKYCCVVYLGIFDAINFYNTKQSV